MFFKTSTTYISAYFTFAIAFLLHLHIQKTIYLLSAVLLPLSSVLTLLPLPLLGMYILRILIRSPRPPPPPRRRLTTLLPPQLLTPPPFPALHQLPRHRRPRVLGVSGVLFYVSSHKTKKTICNITLFALEIQT